MFKMYLFLPDPGHHPGQHPLPSAHRPGVRFLPRRVAFRPASIGRPLWGGARTADQGLAALALSPDHLAAEPSCLPLPGLPVGQGQGSPGGPEGGSGAGGGASQRLSGHAGSVSVPAGDGGVAVGEHQPAGHRRWGAVVKFIGHTHTHTQDSLLMVVTASETVDGHLTCAHTISPSFIKQKCKTSASYGSSVQSIFLCVCGLYHYKLN